MKWRTIGVVVALLISLSQVAGASGFMHADVYPHNVEGETIGISISHDYPHPTTFPEKIEIRREPNDEVVAQYYLSEEERRAEEGESFVWSWDQRHACYGQCQNVWEGDPVGPGRYWVDAIPPDPGEDYPHFNIGAFFHLGFEGRPNADFIVFPNRREIIDQMRAELDKPQEERQIVAGTVRRKTTAPLYNWPWSYVLGPGSLFLGEVFIEVCDGSPGYVERHLKQWRGEQWCPWSSYVESEGL